MQTLWNRKGKDLNSSDNLTLVLFIIYLIVLFWILLFKLGVKFAYMETRIVNLIPFRDFFLSNYRVNKVETILNIIIFIPFGVYISVLAKKWAWSYKLFFFFLISLMLEVLQYIFRIGAFDITDVITNVFGGVIGLLIFKAIEKLFNNIVKYQKFINIIALMGTVFMISFLVLLKLNMLPIRYQ